MPEPEDFRPAGSITGFIRMESYKPESSEPIQPEVSKGVLVILGRTLMKFYYWWTQEEPRAKSRGGEYE